MMEDVTLEQAVALLAEKGKQLRPRGAAGRRNRGTPQKQAAAPGAAPDAEPRKAPSRKAKPAKRRAKAKRAEAPKAAAKRPAVAKAPAKKEGATVNARAQSAGRKTLHALGGIPSAARSCRP